jgi:hypothetical protein
MGWFISVTILVAKESPTQRHERKQERTRHANSHLDCDRRLHVGNRDRTYGRSEPQGFAGSQREGFSSVEPGRTNAAVMAPSRRGIVVNDLFKHLGNPRRLGAKRERPMQRKPIHTSAGEPSFFYLMMAETCFQRADSTRHPKAGSTLLEIGRNYLAKATGVASMLESEPSRLRGTAAH